MSDILNVSVSGLRVSQSALRTIGHNIANANTEGYSRQSVHINSSGGLNNGGNFLGQGSYTANVERTVDNFVTAQIRQETTLHGELKAFNENILQVNELLSNEASGLVSGLQNFSAAGQNVTDDPTSLASRQLYVTEADNLAKRFNSIYDNLDTINNTRSYFSII